MRKPNGVMFIDFDDLPDVLYPLKLQALNGIGRSMLRRLHAHRIFEMRPIHWLLEKNTIVICAGGGGIPTAYDEDRNLRGVEVVIDKDRASALLAFELDADLLILATDTDGVYLNWGTDDAKKIEQFTPEEIEHYEFDSGSMGPKVEAAANFVRRTGQRAVIGALADLEAVVAGKAGTQFVLEK